LEKPRQFNASLGNVLLLLSWTKKRSWRGAAGCIRETATNDAKMIRVEILNTDNLVKDWSVDNFPPPPDHNLRCPIVNFVLNQWSPDPGARNEVLRWVERVLTRPRSEHKTNNELLSDDLNVMLPLEISKSLKKKDVRVERKKTCVIKLNREHKSHDRFMCEYFKVPM